MSSVSGAGSSPSTDPASSLDNDYQDLKTSTDNALADGDLTPAEAFELQQKSAKLELQQTMLSTVVKVFKDEAKDTIQNMR